MASDSREQVALLPCPFCGRDDIYLYSIEGGWSVAQCQSCNVNIRGLSRARAVAGWNRRPSRADASPPWIDKAPAEDTIASHLRNLQQLIELRTERPLAITKFGLHEHFLAHATFVGDELDAVNARIAKALALAEQGEKDTARLDFVQAKTASRLSPRFTIWGNGDMRIDFMGDVPDGNGTDARAAIDAARLAEQVTT